MLCLKPATAWQSCCRMARKLRLSPPHTQPRCSLQDAGRLASAAMLRDASGCRCRWGRGPFSQPLSLSRQSPQFKCAALSTSDLTNKKSVRGATFSPEARTCCRHLLPVVAGSRCHRCRGKALRQRLVAQVEHWTCRRVNKKNRVRICLGMCPVLFLVCLLDFLPCPTPTEKKKKKKKKKILPCLQQNS